MVRSRARLAARIRRSDTNRPRSLPDSGVSTDSDAERTPGTARTRRRVSRQKAARASRSLGGVPRCSGSRDMVSTCVGPEAQVDGAQVRHRPHRHDCGDQQDERERELCRDGDTAPPATVAPSQRVGRRGQGRTRRPARRRRRIAGQRPVSSAGSERDACGKQADAPVPSRIDESGTAAAGKQARSGT